MLNSLVATQTKRAQSEPCPYKIKYPLHQYKRDILVDILLRHAMLDDTQQQISPKLIIFSLIGSNRIISLMHYLSQL